MKSRDSILLVDDDQRFRDRLGLALRERSLLVHLAQDNKSALELAKEHDPWGVVTDLRMPGVSGLELVRSLIECCPNARLVVLTGYGSIASAVEATRLGAKDYLVKPCNADQVLHALSDDEAISEEHLAAKTPSLARLEHEHIERVMLECHGNVSKAARVLGIHRRTLQYKLSKLPNLR
jgi:two-component system response regulator RegA